MAIVIDANGATSAINCFITLADANTYFEKRLHDTAWTSASTADKESALLWASLQLSTLKYKGVKTYPSSMLAWPRKGVSYTEWYEPQTMSPIEYYDSYGYVSSTRTIADTEIPFEIANCCAETALALIVSDTTTPTATSIAGITEVKADTVSVKFSDKVSSTILTPTIRNILAPFLLNSSPYNVPVIRV